MYKIKRFFKRILRAYRYVKLVFNTEPWDYSFALEFWKQSLNDIKHEILTGYHANPELTTKRIDQINALLTRLQNYQEIQELHYKAYDRKYGKLTYEFERVPGTTMSTMNFTNKNRETPQARKEFDNIRKHIEYMYRQDIDLLAKLLKSHLRKFWD